MSYYKFPKSLVFIFIFYMRGTFPTETQLSLFLI